MVLRDDPYADLDNRELRLVPRPAYERAKLLSTSRVSLRLQDLAWSELEALGSYLNIYLARQGTVILQEASPARWMALVAAGEVEILKLDASRRNRVLATIGPGHLLGEMAFLDGQTRSATAVATTDTTLLVLTRAALEQLLRENPALVLKVLPGLIRMLILRVRRTNLQFVDRLTD